MNIHKRRVIPWAKKKYCFLNRDPWYTISKCNFDPVLGLISSELSNKVGILINYSASSFELLVYHYPRTSWRVRRKGQDFRSFRVSADDLNFVPPCESHPAQTDHAKNEQRTRFFAILSMELVYCNFILIRALTVDGGRFQCCITLVSVSLHWYPYSV